MKEPVFLLVSLSGIGDSPGSRFADTDRRSRAHRATVRDAAQPPATETRAYVKVTGTTDEPSPDDALEITFLDVASSALIQLPKVGSVLIDGGPREGGPERVANLQRLGVSQLDAGEFG